MRLPARLALLTLPCVLAVAQGSAAAGYGFKEAEHSLTLNLGDVSPPATVRPELNQWQSTGVRLQQGATYLVYAEGAWRLGPLCAGTGPDGGGMYTLTCWDLGGKTVEGITHSALIGRIGHDGPPFAVRSSLELTADRNGYLYLMANEHPSFFFDNTGSVTAKVRMLTAPAARGGTEATEITIRQENREGASTVTIKRGGGGGGGGGAAGGGGSGGGGGRN